jgi:enoyl-CoA hydratase/carnithine racemase
MGNEVKMVRELAGGMIKLSCMDHIGTILIDNPPRKNAVTAAMWRAIPEAVRWLVAEAGARVLILAGSGSTDFSAGADISEFGEVRRDTETARIYEAENSMAFAAIRTAPVPVIAMIRGICYGGGFGLAAACDLRVADSTARFCIPPARLGLAYPADAVGDILRALGDQNARFALFTGEVMRGLRFSPEKSCPWNS